MTTNTLAHFKNTFNGVGWFIPPYVSIGFLSIAAQRIISMGQSFTQSDLQNILALIYSPENLAAMVSERYPITPHVQDYKIVISEAVQAHILGLDHIAVVGLMPAIEGAGKNLAKSRSIPCEGISARNIFVRLAKDCKEDAQKNNIGAVGEIISMMDSFSEFANKHLYIESSQYQHSDRTNRHGILHGAYSDEDYGRPINFYKAIAAIDFLSFISAFRASISWFAPAPTDRSNALVKFYLACRHFKKANPINLHGL